MTPPLSGRQPDARHPWWAVTAVSLATFSVVTTEMLPVGLLTRSPTPCRRAPAPQA